ncbi:hypothetical protein [Brevibacillus dissolubilis]|uniref:hypothetical protein n=1 Tax=Brevibacillus dissolubilis TaxID=1844116 RepID=UPI00111689C3|nr:hypothetical protein [Brevibacillus dissolubilis]
MKQTWNEWVERSFAKAADSTEAPVKLANIPFHRKALAVAGIISIPAVLSGCAEEEPTAYDECKYQEQQDNQVYYCDDDDADFYKKKGYKNKYSLISKSSPAYNKIVSSRGGFGSGSGGSYGG